MGSAGLPSCGAVGTWMCFPGVTRSPTRGTPMGGASKGGFGERGGELLNPQAEDQCITLTRVKNNRLVSRNEPVCNYSLACLLRSVPALAPRQAPANNPCLSSPPCHCLFYLGEGGVLCGFELVGLFFPFPSRSKAAAPCPSLGSPHPPSHGLQKPPVLAPRSTATLCPQGHVVPPRSPRTGGQCHQPTLPGGRCSGQYEPARGV